MWALFAAIAVADLPVHCLRNEIVGTWTFTLGPLAPTRSSCGHSRPDLASAQPALTLDKSTELEVTFSEPYHVRAGDKTGTFSMIYDEGLDFKVDGKAFFAFSGFTLQNGVNQSHCDQTELGWYSTEDRTQFGCFYGVKKGATPVLIHKEAAKSSALVRKEPAVEEPVEKPVKKVTEAEAPVKKITDSKELKKNVEKLLQMSYFAATTPAYHAEKVSFLNTHVTTWRAKVYDQYVGKSIEWLNNRAGIRRAKIHPHGKKPAVSLLSLRDATAHSEALKKTLPKEFDWRKTQPCPQGDAECASKHPNGRNILEQVMDQGDCGSCYVVSSVRMLSARHKLKQGADAVPFSISFPLQCSEYNQGCAGGYGVLVARWSEDVGLVPATCGRYSTSGQCSNYEHSCASLNGTRYRASNHRYVGGYYGISANEAEMMQELMDNGPFVVGVEPKDDFMYYSEGIYSSGPSQPGTDGWQRVDHAVLLVGWGEENGVPYWVIQNSWDNYWGEDGYMRIKRGENDSGIESIPEAADVVVDESNGARVSSFISQAGGN
jgi:cathepsin C